MLGLWSTEAAERVSDEPVLGVVARGGRIDPADEGISMLETCMPRKPREDRPLIGRPEPPPSRRGRKGRGRGLAARDSYGRDADDDDDELL